MGARGCPHVIRPDRAARPAARNGLAVPRPVAASESGSILPDNLPPLGDRDGWGNEPHFTRDTTPIDAMGGRIVANSAHGHSAIALSVRTPVQRRHVSLEPPKTFPLPLQRPANLLYIRKLPKASPAAHACGLPASSDPRLQWPGLSADGYPNPYHLPAVESASSFAWRSSTDATRDCSSNDFRTRHDHRTAVVLPARRSATNTNHCCDLGSPHPLLLLLPIASFPPLREICRATHAHPP